MAAPANLLPNALFRFTPVTYVSSLLVGICVCVCVCSFVVYTLVRVLSGVFFLQLMSQRLME